MLDADKAEFKSELTAVMALFDKDKPTNPVLRLWWEALCNYDLDTFIHALDEHVKHSKFSPKPADIIELISKTDGRPTSDEAWATALHAADEGATIIWTDEIAAALNMGAGDLLADGDKTAARMAFRDSYNRLIEQARDSGVPLKTWVSQGHNVEGRNSAIEQAVSKGLLSQEYGKSLMLEHTTHKGNKLKRLVGQTLSEQDEEKRLRNWSKIKEALA